MDDEDYVYDDLGLENSEELLEKTRICEQIESLIKLKRLSRKKASYITGADMQGDLLRYAAEDLICFFNQLVFADG